MSPERTALDQAIDEEIARVCAQVRREIAELRRLVDDSWNLIEEIRRQREAPPHCRGVGAADESTTRD
jgi:hypothetical protein